MFAWLGGALIVLTLVIVVSAMQRMVLYVASYGLTELRLYTSAFMMLIVALFVWFAPTVLRGRRERFATGALWIGAAAALLLEIANPDGIIARTNLERRGRQQNI